MFTDMYFWIFFSLAVTGVALFFAYRTIAGATGNTKAGRALMATGSDAQATILGLQQTGTFINNNPQVVLSLQVNPPGQPSFQAQTSTIVPLVAVPQFQPGNMVNVKYDPMDHSKVMLATT